jgi:serine/threonine protein kinase
MKLQIESEGVPSTVIREISLLAEFSHPNIVKLIDVIIDERQLYVILEYVDHDLRQHLSDMMRDQFLPPI